MIQTKICENCQKGAKQSVSGYLHGRQNCMFFTCEYFFTNHCCAQHIAKFTLDWLEERKKDDPCFSK